MTTKTELQQEIESLAKKLTSFDQLLNRLQDLEVKLASLPGLFSPELHNYKEITIGTANPGDVLEDGSIVVKKENGLALLAGPASVEVICQWTKAFPDVFVKLKEQEFNISQWFVPTKEQLNLAFQNPKVREHFASSLYWSSTEVSSTIACFQNFNIGFISSLSKTNTRCVRPFRCVVFEP
jgi:hypothetical protein